jgi:hypothetical protein
MKRLLLPTALILTAAYSATAQSATPDAGRTAAAELLADAAGRSSGLGQAGLAGVRQADKNGFTVNVHGYFQTRYYLNFRDEAPAGDEDLTTGFQMRRTRITVEGDLAPQWGYKVQGNFSRNTGVFELTDGYGTYSPGNDWTITFGQFKLPFSREELVGATVQLSADRSVTNAVFTMNRSQGVQAAYQSGDWRIAGAFSDGGNTVNMDFNSPGEADYALTGRAEWKWAGEWKQFKDFTSFRESGRAGLLGAALHWQSGGETGGPTADVDVLSATVDLSLEGDGWNAFGAAFYRSADSDALGDLNDLGFLAQAGYFVNDVNEVFARYDVAIPDDDRADNADPFSTLTFGLNHYCIPRSHAAKFTAEVLWFLDSTSQTGGLVSPSTSVGLLPDNGDNQAALRLQMQIVF